MRVEERDGLLAYRFEGVAGEGLDCLVSTRGGGVSERPCTSLNVGFKVEDDGAAVLENRRRLLTAFGFELERTVWGEQVHGDRVAVVRAEDAGRGALDAGSAIAGVDALVTDVPGLALCATVADCVPLVLFDPVVGALGVAHAGWSGTVAKIAARTAETMAESFGSSPSNLLAAIGPSIGPDAYEVGGEVIARVHDTFGAHAAELLTPLPGGKALLDLWRANSLALIECGVQEARIEVAGISTAAHLDHFYSYRSEGLTGRFCVVAALSAVNLSKAYDQ
ncbi:MAG TPA: peptidoglycan editing factor PgeF [Solirubrobacterales bacterium]|nr:peptidoglycan editing factor PgeF [Solirubrobacterales bacterium]